ncbi:MAG: tyrosine-type recombinase/integrase [Armatimonas sp.]
MALGYTTSTWYEAFEDFLISLEARNRATRTVSFYRTQLRQLIQWAVGQKIPLEEFGKRHLDRYLAERRQTVSRTTLRHDAVCMVAFAKWCSKNDYLDRNPLAEYEVKAAPRTAKYVPTEEEVRTLLKSLDLYWNPENHPGMKNIPVTRRSVHRHRNRAIILMLLDTTARIGEVANLKIDDYRSTEMQISIREAKGKRPRVIPVSPGTVEAVASWLKIRDRMMQNVTPEEDGGWLFLSEYGTQLDTRCFSKAFKAILRWAGLSDKITLHSLRHYSLTRLAKFNRVVAQQIAGHRNPLTTDIYIHLDADYTRQVHAQVGVVDTILENRRIARRKRLT